MLALLAGNAVAQEVGADRALKSNIAQFKTYAWTEKIDNIPGDAVVVSPGGVMLFNNESTRSHIKEAIRYELDARGYKPSDANADFLVHFSVLEQPTELVTYNGYRVIQNGLDTVRTPENLERLPVEKGTVLINFIDRKSGQQVWQGYASGILKADMVNDRSKVRNAIASIFNEFKYKAFAKE